VARHANPHGAGGRAPGLRARGGARGPARAPAAATRGRGRPAVVRSPRPAGGRRARVTGMRRLNRFGRRGRLVLALACALAGGGAAAAQRAPPKFQGIPQKPVNYRVPPREYVTSATNGWRLELEKQLTVDEPALAAKAAARLAANLNAALAALPAACRDKLRRHQVFLLYGPKAKHDGRDNGAEYFQPSAPACYTNLDVRWGGSIVVYCAANYVWQTDLWALKLILHELAHAYHLEQWPEDQADICRAFTNALQHRLYCNVQDNRGKLHARAYALQNPMEYFAELTCMYFAACNYPPHDRRELQAYDPEGYALIRKLWAVGAADAGPGGTASTSPAAPGARREPPPRRRPDVYLTVFNNGYGSDDLPADPAQFERLVATVAGQGHFNAVLCHYSAARLAACRQHGVRMIVDLLGGEAHVFKNPAACEALCARLRDDPTVAAYHLWADRFGKLGPGRARDIANVHRWDPTHATYSGTYQSGGLGYLAESDFISYYDFAWKRGIQKNFPNLLAAWNVARQHDQRLGRYVEADAGLPGKGNFNRELFTQNTSIACGLRAVLWFIGSRMLDPRTLQLNPYGLDAGRVNQWLEPLWHELPKLGLPTAIYATPVTLDFNNRPVAATPAPVFAPGLEQHPFPKDFWLQPLRGEFVLGLSRYADTAAEAAYAANLNAYAGQEVQCKLGRSVKAELFDRATGRYAALPQADGVIAFQLEPGGGALLRFQ